MPRKLINFVSKFKDIKKYKKIISGVVWTFLGLYILLFTLTHIPQFQQFLGSQVAKVLSDKLGTKVSVGRVDFGFFNRIIIDDVLILDQRQDELLKASRLSAKLDLLPLYEGRVSISAAQLFGAHLKLYRDSAAAQTNIQFVLDSLASRDTTTHTPLDLRINSLIMRHSSFSYDQHDAEKTEGRLNLQHLNMSDISAHIVLKALKEDSLNLNIKKLSFNEHSGLTVKRLTFHAEASLRQATVKDFLLQLPHSNLQLGDVTAYYQVTDGSLRPGSLTYRGTIEESDITFSDIVCLYPDIQSISNNLSLAVSFSGTDNSIDIHNLTANATDGNISIHASGFVHHWDDRPAWQVQLDQLTLTPEAIAFAQKKAGLPDIITHFGKVSMEGEAEGTGNALTANTVLSSDAGTFDLKFDMNQQQHFNGHVESDGIQLRRLFADERFGEAAMDLDFDGQLHKGQRPDISAQGTVARFDYNGYQYNNIDLALDYLAQGIKGSITIDDPNIRLTADGEMTNNKNRYDVLLTAQLDNFNPSMLNLTKQWDKAVFGADLTADFTASSLNDATGTIELSHFQMQSENSTYRLQNLNIISGYDDEQRHFLALKSDFATALLKGTFDYATLPQSLANLVGSHLPTLPGLPQMRPTDNNFTFQLDMFRSDWLQHLFGVPVTLTEPLLLSGFVNDQQETISVMGSCPDFTYDEGRYTNAALHIGTSADTLRCALDVAKHMANGIPMDVSIRSGAADNQLNAALSWDNHNDALHISGTLNTSSRFVVAADGRQQSIISILPSRIVMQDADWHVAPSEITYAKNDLTVSHFAIEHGQQHINIDGRASTSPDDSLTVDLEDVDVEYVLDLVNFHSVDFGGFASGTASVRSLFDSPQAKAHLKVKEFKFESGLMGVLDVNAAWDNEKKTIDLNGIVNDGPSSMTLVNGYIDPSSPGYIDLDIQGIGTHIDFVHSYISTFSDRVTGQTDGQLRLYGPLDDINLVGQLVLDAEMDVRQLNTTYTMRRDTINFIPDDIELHRCKAYDRDGHIATVNGYLHHKHLTRMTFDIDIEAENFLAYDFHDFGSETFYGTVYGTGSVAIQGRPGRITFDIDATPCENTVFVYNVSTPDAITNQEFITWESTRYEIRDTRYENTSADVSSLQGNLEPRTSNLAPRTTDIFLNFIIRCTPEATIRLLMDAKTGDYITLNGSGTIRANYYNKGGMQMFGTYTVSEGTYNITIQELIKKNFTFQNGGTVVFGGAPFDAQLNLQAQHTVNGVSLSDLNVGRSFSSNTVRINCLMNISGVANAPQVEFDLAMPTVSADEQQMIRSVINGQQEMNQQVLYLLGIGRFYPQTGNNATAEGQTQQSQTSLAMQSLLSGTLSSQINSLLKNVVNNNNWNFGANISTGDEGWNNAEYEGLISGRLLNNRLLINGQFGYRDRTTTTTPSFIGDFDVQYLLTPNGSVSIKMYNQTNDRYFTRSSLNTQGLGFILKKDFSSLPDLFGIDDNVNVNVNGNNTQHPTPNNRNIFLTEP